MNSRWHHKPSFCKQERPSPCAGVLDIIDRALAANARVGLIANTLSLPGESVVTSALTHLGPERVRQLQVIPHLPSLLIFISSQGFFSAF